LLKNASAASSFFFFYFRDERTNAIRKPQAKVTELLKPVPSSPPPPPSPSRREVTTGLPRSSIASTLAARVLQLADRNGSATFETPINHRRRRSDLRRLDEPRCREYISVDVYPDTGVSENRPTPPGSAWLLQPFAQIKLPPSKSRRRGRCTRVLDLVCASHFLMQQESLLPMPATDSADPALVLEDIPGVNFLYARKDKSIQVRNPIAINSISYSYSRALTFEILRDAKLRL